MQCCFCFSSVTHPNPSYIIYLYYHYMYFYILFIFLYFNLLCNFCIFILLCYYCTFKFYIFTLLLFYIIFYILLLTHTYIWINCSIFIWEKKIPHLSHSHTITSPCLSDALRTPSPCPPVASRDIYFLPSPRAPVLPA